ncbi:hypothetical protein CYV15_05990 [Riemerella anatipestifer]|uniref:hypothetical protein n=1 Tax=Riemerella anatipestifer TaxID=34085 RepID=UPI000D1400C1|nr:hypothetical protein [Riemerella anatipestifer]MDD1525122.1 hypothetical protein [Riemerella anatipestifer]MDY3339283.1 hypothetical protein [Riemerella anatipestifer]PST44165.1 hypothetical protein CYV15_05990 [Riemerella anatipestifer]
MTIDKYIIDQSIDRTVYEYKKDNNYLILSLYNDFVEIKFNIVEVILTKNIDELYQEFLNGNYYIKMYRRDNYLLYSKFVWKRRELRKYNQKTKYGFLRCKKINKVEMVKGIPWQTKLSNISQEL